MAGNTLILIEFNHWITLFFLKYSIIPFITFYKCFLTHIENFRRHQQAFISFCSKSPHSVNILFYKQYELSG
jgi:hypothetical protein